MYKLRVYIYLNRLLFDARQKSYEFKSWSNLDLPKEISKSQYVGRFSLNHDKSNFKKAIPFILFFDLLVVSKLQINFRKFRGRKKIPEFLM